jgi:hypothetical protein
MGGNVIPLSRYNEVKGFFDKVKAGDDQPALVRFPNSASAN